MFDGQVFRRFDQLVDRAQVNLLGPAAVVPDAPEDGKDFTIVFVTHPFMSTLSTTVDERSTGSWKGETSSPVSHPEDPMLKTPIFEVFSIGEAALPGPHAGGCQKSCRTSKNP